MKKVIESLRLKDVMYVIRKWLKRNKDDDDKFNHPFAIF